MSTTTSLRNNNEKTLARRPSKLTVAIGNDNRDENWADETNNDSDKAEEDIEDDSGDDGEFDMLNIMKEIQKRQVKAASRRSAALQSQKDALFSAARKNAIELVHSTNLHVNGVLAKITEMKNQEVPYQKFLKDTNSLWGALDETVDSLMAVYPPLIDDLFSRRVEVINAASSMLQNNPIKREKVRGKLMKDAYIQLNQSLENEKIATDATALIKHYKALMLVKSQAPKQHGPWQH